MDNYPNPFNPVTNIKFALPGAEHVKVVIVNMLGQTVRTMENDYKAGVHVLQWDGRNNSGIQVGSGIYVYRVIAGSNIATKKMTLIK